MLLSLLLACPKPPEPQYECKADPKWITSPLEPNEIAADESFCDFYQFSWQWFLAQTSPAVSNSEERVFETQRVFSKTFGEDQCKLSPQTGREAALSVVAPGNFLNPEDFENQQADGKALYDQNGNLVLYNLWYAQANCNATEKGFVDGTMEIKASWIKLDKEDPTYFSIATIDQDTKEPIYLGMVGFHLAIFTQNHPEMIWATWEHKDNAPLCNGSSPIKDYNFASKAGSACLAEKKSAGACNFNIATEFTTPPPPSKSKPNEICREFEYGNQAGAAKNGNDNDQNLKVIKELNEQLVGVDGFLTKLDDKDPMKVWANYELIGGLWTKNGADSGNAPVDTAKSSADPTSPQRGSLELTNMTMETFEQGASSTVPNCFSCHHYKSESPLTVSHIQKYLITIPQ